MRQWQNQTPVVEISANYTATVLNRTIICTDELILTIPVSGIPDGHIFEIMNAVGMSGTAGDLGNVAVDITGSTIKFNGGTHPGIITLVQDGWVLKIQWSSSAQTYWVLKHQIVLSTNQTPPE